MNTLSNLKSRYLRTGQPSQVWPKSLTLISLLRYDLLCIEGIARALRVFLGKDKAPHYRLVNPPGGEANILQIPVSKEVRSFLATKGFG